MVNLSEYNSILEEYINSLKLNEVYFKDQPNLDKHYKKHVESDDDGILKMDYMSKENYNELANFLSNHSAENLNSKESRYVGYVSQDGSYVKYDKEKHLVVVYNDDTVKSLYIMPYKKFINSVNGLRKPEFKFKSHLPVIEKQGREETLD